MSDLGLWERYFLEAILVLGGVYIFLLLISLMRVIGVSIFTLTQQKKSFETERFDDGGGIPKLIVTLVHGAWAKSAEWTRPSSNLSKTLKIYCGKNSVFQRFLWSGRNSIQARTKASSDLKAKLDQLVQKYPN